MDDIVPKNAKNLPKRAEQPTEYPSYNKTVDPCSGATVKESNDETMKR
jgi:hypothetical protein